MTKLCWLYEKGKPEDGEEVDLTDEQFENVKYGYGDYLVSLLPDHAADLAKRL